MLNPAVKWQSNVVITGERVIPVDNYLDTTQSLKMEVIFKLNHCETKYGQNCVIIGGSPHLGSWDPDSAPIMSSEETYPKWELKNRLVIESLEEASHIEYKYIIKGSKNNWEDGDNRVIDLSRYYESGQAVVVVEDQRFNETEEVKIYPEG